MSQPSPLLRVTSPAILQSAISTCHIETPAKPSRELWLALYFPALVLEALVIDPKTTAAAAVLGSEDPKAPICAVTAAAEKLGIRTGMNAQLAHAISPRVRFLYRDPAAEMAILQKLAIWAQQFTPTISVHVPDTLLLEIHGSLHLFGDERALHDRMHGELSSRGSRMYAAFAPTPRAASWLAQSGHETCVADITQLRSMLGKLPLTALRWPTEWLEACGDLGLHTLRDVLRLPRAGLARRFGPALIVELDRALGAISEPQTLWNAPLAYEAAEDLGFETCHTDILMPVIEKLLNRVSEMLRSTDSGIRSFEIGFSAHGKDTDRLRIETQQVTRDVGHWLKLVRVHLEQFRLGQTVDAVRLKSAAFERYQPEIPHWFTHAARSPASSSAALVDTLRARLGYHGIAGLRAVATRRPEKAWRFVVPGDGAVLPIRSPERPLWLLDNPQSLAVMDARPARAGVLLEMEAGPERIECGGWSGWEVRRDYYIARDPRGGRLWVYRDLNAPSRWFLHGYFG